MCVVLLIDTCIEICTEVKIKFIIIALSAAVFKHAACQIAIFWSEK